MVNSLNFDYEYFQKILSDATKNAFRALQQQHSENGIYAFGLESHTEFESLFPFILTEQKLTDNVLDWLTTPKPYLSAYQDLSEQQLRSYLRYSFFSERDYDVAEKYFDKVHHLQSKGLRQFDGMLISARKELSEEELRALTIEHESKFRDACLAALQTLDKQGIFGTGIERENIVLMLYFTGYGSLDGQTLEYIKALNAETVVKRYEAEIADIEGSQM